MCEKNNSYTHLNFKHNWYYFIFCKFISNCVSNKMGGTKHLKNIWKSINIMKIFTFLQICATIQNLLYIWGEKGEKSSQTYNQCKTQDKRPLGRDPWTMCYDQESFKIVWQWHQLLSGSLPKGHVSLVSCQL